MKLTKREYATLYYINYGRNTPERLQKVVTNMEKIVRMLEKKRLVKIEMNENEIYAFMETPKGLALLKEKKYARWYTELGD